MLCRGWKCVPTAISGGVDILQGPCVSFVTKDEFPVRVKKLHQGLMSHELTDNLSVFNLFLTYFIMNYDHIIKNM